MRGENEGTLQLACGNPVPREAHPCRQGSSVTDGVPGEVDPWGSVDTQ
jgi:hypothetical protein